MEIKQQSLIFRIKQRASNFFQRGNVVAVYPQFAASWMHADIASFVNKGYCGNVYVYSVIRQIATRCKSIPWRVYRVTDEKALRRYKAALSVPENRLAWSTRVLKEESLEADDSHELNKIFERPNPLQSWSEYVEALVSWRNIAGESFTWGISPQSGPNKGKFIELLPYDPRLLQVEQPEWPNPVKSYLYKGTKPIPPEEIMHLRYFNPQDMRVGLAPIGPAVKPVTQSNSYFDWNTSLVQNMGRHSGILKVKVQKLDAKQRAELREEWLQTMAGEQNAGMPFITANDMEFLETGFQPKEMDWVAGVNLTAKQIAVAFDWPSQLIGDPDVSKYSNVQEMIRYAYFGKIIPEMDSLRDGLNSWLVPGYQSEGMKLFADYSLEDIEILQEERKAVHDRALASFQGGAITLNQFLYETGRTEIGPEGEIRLLPLGFSVWDPGEEPAMPTDEEFAKAFAAESLEEEAKKRRNGDDEKFNEVLAKLDANEEAIQSVRDAQSEAQRSSAALDSSLRRLSSEVSSLPKESPKIELPAINVSPPAVNVDVQQPQVNLTVENRKGGSQRVRVMGEDGKVLRTLEINRDKEE